MGRERLTRTHGRMRKETQRKVISHADIRYRGRMRGGRDESGFHARFHDPTWRVDALRASSPPERGRQLSAWVWWHATILVSRSLLRRLNHSLGTRKRVRPLDRQPASSL